MDIRKKEAVGATRRHSMDAAWQGSIQRFEAASFLSRNTVRIPEGDIYSN